MCMQADRAHECEQGRPFARMNASQAGQSLFVPHAPHKQFTLYVLVWIPNIDLRALRATKSGAAAPSRT